MKNKKIIYGVAVVAILAAVYYTMKKKKVAVDNTLLLGVPATLPFTVIAIGDITKTVYLLKDGKLYEFMAETPYSSLGYASPKLIAKPEFDTYPISGYVDEDGTIIDLKK